MASRILKVPKKEIPINWLTADEQEKAPDVVFHVYITQAPEKQPPYDTPKKYPEDILELVKRAKVKAEEKKKKGYDRDQAFEDLLKIQNKISNNIKEQK